MHSRRWSIQCRDIQTKVHIPLNTMMQPPKLYQRVYPDRAAQDRLYLHVAGVTSPCGYPSISRVGGPNECTSTLVIICSRTAGQTWSRQ